MKKYTVGIDFGTLSGRAVLVDVKSGEEIASVVMDYPHAVIDSILPASGEVLPINWALEDPRDYLAVLEYLFPALCREAGIEKERRRWHRLYLLYHSSHQEGRHAPCFSARI